MSTTSGSAVSPDRTAGRRKARRRRWTFGLALALLLSAALPPLINLGRFQRRIVGSVSRSVGRPIAFRSLSFRLLPWPALLFQDFAVDEDPRFGLEPALRASEVIATPRFSSLWRGRFELARVELSSPSVNLVRNPDGRWSVGALLLQASRAPNAPTGQRRPGPAPRFPYITASDAHINLKRGAEKLPFSLRDAEFSMSLASPEVYSLKLEGRPVRTDVVLSANDTGTLRLEGEVHRASAFGAMPLALHAEWKEASLGQLTELFSGRDLGWRALVDASAQLTGDLDHLSVRTRIVAANLHRQDFTPERAYTVDARCRGLYSRADPSADTYSCRWPLGAGALTLTDSAAPAPPGGQTEPIRAYTLDLDRIPADVLAATLGLIRQALPAPGRFGGELTGTFNYRPADRLLSGGAAMPRLSFSEAAPGGEPLLIHNLKFAADPSAQQPEVAFTADPVDFQAPGRPLALSARFSRHGWTAAVAGGARLGSLQALAAALRAPGLDRFGDGESEPARLRFALNFTGRWSSGMPDVSGTVSVGNLLWQPPWLPFPVDLAAADTALTPGLARWNLHAAQAGPLRLSGTAQLPLACEPPTPCITRFALQTPVLDAAALQSALTGNRPELVQLLLRRFQSRARLPAFLGTLHADSLLFGPLPIRNAQASLSSGIDPNLPESAVALQFLTGSALGGMVQMQGTLSLAGALPAYRLHTAFTHAGAAEAGALFGEIWPPGVLSGSADFSMSGAAAPSLLASLAGNWQAAWLNGSLGQAFTEWAASGTLAPSGLLITRGTLAPSGDAVTGTIGWDRALHLQLTPPDSAPASITGTLAQPDLQPAAQHH